MCVCVYLRERQREREGERPEERDRERHTGNERQHVTAVLCNLAHIADDVCENRPSASS